MYYYMVHAVLLPLPREITLRVVPAGSSSPHNNPTTTAIPRRSQPTKTLDPSTPEVSIGVRLLDGAWIGEREQCSEPRAVTPHDGLDEPSPSSFSRFALRAAQAIYWVVTLAPPHGVLVDARGRGIMKARGAILMFEHACEVGTRPRVVE
jgi:hypothetical protein